MENELHKPGRPPKNADILNRDSAENLDPRYESIEQLSAENMQLRETIGMFSDRLARIEAVQSKAKLRKYDELNDLNPLKKIGRILSEDGKDPVLFLKKAGKVEKKGDEYVDKQTLHGETASGKKVTFTLQDMIVRCSGNSIPCIVNNWKEYRDKEKELMDKRHQYQRSNGKSARVNTVALKEEIKKLEEDLRMNVTLSEDDGKTFTGMTVDIHPVSVFNAMP